MTVETQYNIVAYDGDDLADTFPFLFPIYDASHLQVYSVNKLTQVQTLVSDSNYSVSGIGDEIGGSVVMDTPPASTVRLYLTRQVPLTQNLSVENQGGFYPINYEIQLDLMQMQVQQIREELWRTIRAPLGEYVNVLPTPAERAGLVIGFDESGALVVVSPDMQDAWLLEDGSGVGGSGGTAITEETVRDVIGAALTGSSLITVAVDDVANTITISADTTTLDERTRDTMGSVLIEGSGIALEIDDTANTIEINVAPNILSVTSTATLTPTFAEDQVNVTAQAAGLTIAAPTGTAVDGHGLLLRIKDNGTSRALTWNAIFRVFNDALPAATVVSKTLYVGAVYNLADNKWDILGVRSQA